MFRGVPLAVSWLPARSSDGRVKRVTSAHDELTVVVVGSCMRLSGPGRDSSGEPAGTPPEKKSPRLLPRSLVVKLMAWLVLRYDGMPSRSLPSKTAAEAGCGPVRATSGAPW